jgi:hypothetical protein
MQIPLFMDHSLQGTYFTVPFIMPEGIETLSISYSYPRHDETESQVENGAFIARKEINIIDLGLIAPDGRQVGASGSDKLSISISETRATPGYNPCKLVPGLWKIIVGAYKVAEGGVTVNYQISFTPKRLRLFKGDLHTHTFASDGVLSIEALAQHAALNGLDFLAITEHNQMTTTGTLLEHPHLTLIPGIEWTHYRGHANFLGVDRPYDQPFMANTFEEVQARFASARARGAFISINHPFDPVVPFQFDIASLPFDCLEVWNGPMRPNLQAIGLWQSMLSAAGRFHRGGSDYHRDSCCFSPRASHLRLRQQTARRISCLGCLGRLHHLQRQRTDPGDDRWDAMLGTAKFSHVQQVEYTARACLLGTCADGHFAWQHCLGEG